MALPCEGCFFLHPKPRDEHLKVLMCVNKKRDLGLLYERRIGTSVKPVFFLISPTVPLVAPMATTSKKASPAIGIVVCLLPIWEFLSKAGKKKRGATATVARRKTDGQVYFQLNQ